MCKIIAFPNDFQGFAEFMSIPGVVFSVKPVLLVVPTFLQGFRVWFSFAKHLPICLLAPAQGMLYASWKYSHSNPEKGNHGNVNSLKGLPFGWRDIGNEHFSESTFSDGAE